MIFIHLFSSSYDIIFSIPFADQPKTIERFDAIPIARSYGKTQFLNTHRQIILILGLRQLSSHRKENEKKGSVKITDIIITMII